eukprot:c27529_g1_i2 orf=462-2648(-)
MVRQARGDVAQLLKMGQESSALIRCDFVSKVENSLAAYDLIEQFCQRLIKSLSIIIKEKFCPPDLKQAISSLIFAAPRCADLQELQQVRDIFAAKYGKEFAVAAVELRTDCGVSNQIIEKLSSRPLSRDLRLKLAKEIAAENKIQWDPEKAETEHKRHPEVAPDGHTYFVNASQASTKANDTELKNSEFKYSKSEKVNVSSSSHPPQNPLSLHDKNDLPTELKFSPPHDAPKGSSFTKHQPKGDAQPQENPIFPSDETFRGDPYGRAKAEGRMDYKNVSDFGSREEEIQIKDYDGHPIFGTSFGGDPYSKAKVEGRMDYRNVYDPKSQVETPEIKYEDGSMPTLTPRFPSSKLDEHSSGSEWDQSLESDTSSTEGNDSQYRYLATAAQAALKSATHAAEAARVAVDLAMSDSRIGLNKGPPRGDVVVTDSEGGMGNASSPDYRCAATKTENLAGGNSDSEDDIGEIRISTPNREMGKSRIGSRIKDPIETSSDSEEEHTAPPVSGILWDDNVNGKPDGEGDANRIKRLDLNDSSGWMKAHLGRGKYRDSGFGIPISIAALDTEDSAISAEKNCFSAVSEYHGISSPLQQAGPSFDTNEGPLFGRPRFDDDRHESEADHGDIESRLTSTAPKSHKHQDRISESTFERGGEHEKLPSTYNTSSKWRKSRVHDSPQPQEQITTLSCNDDVVRRDSDDPEQIAEPPRRRPAAAATNSASATKAKSVRTRPRR